MQQAWCDGVLGSLCIGSQLTAAWTSHFSGIRNIQQALVRWRFEEPLHRFSCLGVTLFFLGATTCNRPGAMVLWEPLHGFTTEGGIALFWESQHPTSLVRWRGGEPLHRLALDCCFGVALFWRSPYNILACHIGGRLCFASEVES